MESTARACSLASIMLRISRNSQPPFMISKLVHRNVFNLLLSVKTRLVFYTSEAAMLNFFHRAKILSINLESVPSCIYTKGIHSDLSTFLGWAHTTLSFHQLSSFTKAEKEIRNWMESPTEKIDIWCVDMVVE